MRIVNNALGIYFNIQALVKNKTRCIFKSILCLITFPVYFIVPAQEEIQNYDIYLSASQDEEDQKFAEMLYLKLKRQKFTVFFSGHHNIIGRPLADDVVQMIKDKCTKTLIILSESYNRDEKCTYETRMAHMKSLGKQIVMSFKKIVFIYFFSMQMLAIMYWFQ